MKTLLKYSSNRHSQNGEDGILEEIFKRLAIKTGWFVEFGAWDGKHLSNTYALLEEGWKGVDIEGEPERYKELEKTAAKFPSQLQTIETFVEPQGKNSLNALLKKTSLPKGFDLLSIDIDSHDWWIWEPFSQFNPKVVVIEINSGFPPGKEYVQPLNLTKRIGTSFTSMLRLGREKGYTLVCHTGNMIFVRNDLAGKLNLPKDELESPNDLFVSDWVIKPAPRTHRLRNLLKKIFPI